MINKDKNRLFWASGVGYVYGVYDYTDPENVTTVSQNVVTLPQTIGPGERAYSSEAVLGSASITASSDYVFMLYSGEQLGSILYQMIKAEAVYDSNIILVFDCDGNPVKKLNVDHQLRCICFDSKTGRLYGVEFNDDNEYSLCEIPVEVENA